MLNWSFKLLSEARYILHDHARQSSPLHSSFNVCRAQGCWQRYPESRQRRATEGAVRFHGANSDLCPHIYFPCCPSTTGFRVWWKPGKNDAISFLHTFSWCQRAKPKVLTCFWAICSCVGLRLSKSPLATYWLLSRLGEVAELRKEDVQAVAASTRMHKATNEW